MKILLIMDPGIPVPPPLYGGHERLVYMFAEEYHRQGHQVSLLAGPQSQITGQVYAFGINHLGRSGWQRTKEVLQAWHFLYKKSGEFDLIHNFGRLIYLLPILNSPVKKIMTYGRPVSNKGIRAVNALPNKNLIFTACSQHCVATGNVAGRWQTVYNAVDFSKYQLTNVVADDAPLMFLGRLDKIKGVHNAINVAKKTGFTLWIGGNIPETADNLAYYKQEIEPQIDGKQIVYLGALNDEQKNHYLGQAKALLFPIEWDEPFGMVMVEALACGTPVIAFKRGAVQEIITDRLNGFVVKDTSDMIKSVALIHQVNRGNCRKTVEKRFDVSVIAQAYLTI